MAVRIEDGKGTGLLVEVNSKNRLMTSGITNSKFSELSTEGDAFIVYGKHDIQSSSTDEKLIYFKNNSTNKKIFLNTLVLSTNGSAVKFEVFFDPVYTSGGTTLTALNANRVSSKSASSLVYDNSSNDLVMTIDSTKEILDIRLSSGLPTHVYDINGSIILGPSDTLAIVVEGTSGDKCRAQLTFYEETI